MANEMLARSNNDLVLRRSERDELAAQLDQVLSLIRTAQPATANVHVWQPYSAGVVLIDPLTDLADVLYGLAPQTPGSTAFVTGFDRFDSLNAKLRLHGFSLIGHDYPLLVLCFDDTLNVREAVAAYASLDGVRHALSDRHFGNGPDIEALQDGDTWYVVVMDARGDCPSGCTEVAFFFFTVRGKTVTEIDPSQAEGDARFAQLRGQLGSNWLPPPP